MKKLFLTLISLLLIGNLYAQVEIRHCTHINGYWGEWKSTYNYKMKGTYSNFIIYNSGEHPSNYILKVDVLYIDFSRKMGDGYYVGEANVEYITNTSVTRLGSYVEKFPYINGYGREINKIKSKIYVYGNKKKYKVYNIFLGGGYAIGIEPIVQSFF